MKSRDFLPLKKRDSADREKILKALEAAEAEIEDLRRDGTTAMFVALNYQMLQISTQISGIKIDITSDKSDATFERIIKLSCESRKIMENLNFLKGKSNPEKVKRKLIDGSYVEKIVLGEES